MEVNEAIRTRRAVRAFAPRRVDDATVAALLDAAVHAPSAMNAQPWAFAVVQDPARLKRYSDRAKAALLERTSEHPEAARYAPLLHDANFNIFYDAGTLVAIGVTKRGPFAEADAWLAAQNLMLAAHDAGLGTCCIGFAVAALNEPAALAELGFPPDGAVVAPVIVGYPSVAPEPVARRSARVVSWVR